MAHRRAVANASESRLLSLAGELYDCATHPKAISGLGGVVERAMDIGSSIHFISEQRSGRMLHLLSASPNFDGAARRDYGAYYHQRNVWFQRALHRRPPYVARGEELIANDEFEKTEFCADWCPRVGIRHMIGCIYPIGDDIVGGSGIHKTRTQGAFSDDEKRFYGMLMSHFARAVQIARQLGSHHQAESLSLELIDALDLGVILLRADCSIIFANRTAAAVLRNAKWLTAVSGKARPVHQASLASFARRVGSAARTSAGRGLSTGGVMRLSDPVGGPLAVLIAPFRLEASSLGDARRAAAVIFHNPADMWRKEQAIAEAYGLTRAEGRLVALLVAGNSLVESARKADISVNTAKTQLRSVFAKTGFARQAELVSHVLGNAVVSLAGTTGPHDWKR